MKFMKMMELFVCSRSQFCQQYKTLGNMIAFHSVFLFFSPNNPFQQLPCGFSLHDNSITMLPILQPFQFSCTSDSNKHIYIIFLVGWHRKSLLPNSGNQTQSWLWTNKNRRFRCGSTSHALSNPTSKRRTFSACSTKYAVVRSITSTFYASLTPPDPTFRHQP